MDNTLKSSREELLQPFTNYNLFVIDQTFNKNSSITFTNTNVNRFEKNYKKSNVSSLLIRAVDDNNKYEIGSKINISNVKDNNTLKSKSVKGSALNLLPE